jgi:hypothetical protein
MTKGMFDAFTTPPNWHTQSFQMAWHVFGSFICSTLNARSGKIYTWKCEVTESCVHNEAT